MPGKGKSTTFLLLKLPYRGNFRLLHNFVHVVLPLLLVPPLDKLEMFLYIFILFFLNIFPQPQPQH